jgi:hypothetical protein
MAGDFSGGGTPTTAPAAAPAAPAKAPAAPMVGGGSMGIPSPFAGGAVHPAAAAGRGVMGPTPAGPANPTPQGAPMGGAPHPASNVPIRPIQGPVRPRVM